MRVFILLVVAIRCEMLWRWPAPEDADASEVATSIVKVVDMPFGKRPFRIHVDPAQDGAEIVNGVADRVRAELLRKMGLVDLLKPAPRASI